MKAGQTDRPSVPTAWPVLPPLEDWKDTHTTVHMWSQILGKIRLELAPRLNHSWGSTLYVTTRGLTTSPIPERGRSFAIFLRLCVSEARRIREPPGAARSGVLSRTDGRIHSAVRGGEDGEGPGPSAPLFSPEHVRSRRSAGRMEANRAGTPGRSVRLDDGPALLAFLDDHEPPAKASTAHRSLPRATGRFAQ